MNKETNLMGTKREQKETERDQKESSMNKETNGNQAWRLLLHCLEVDGKLVKLLLQPLPQLLLHLLKEGLLDQIRDFPASKPVERTKPVHLHLPPFHIFQLKLQQFDVSIDLGADCLSQPRPICESVVSKRKYPPKPTSRQIVRGSDPIHLERNGDDQISSPGLDFCSPTSSKSSQTLNPTPPKTNLKDKSFFVRFPGYGHEQ